MKRENILKKVSLVVFAFAVICYFGRNFFGKFGINTEQIFLIILSGGISILAFSYFFYEVYALLRCTEEVPATLLSVEKKPLGKSSSMQYRPVYSYQWQGQYFEQKGKVSFNARYVEKKYAQTGSCTIYINPNDPEMFCDQKKLEGEDFITLLAGIFLVVLTIIFLRPIL